ncbi:hypothetical protein GOB91_09500 [Sinorhizobium meliloti]|uniref:hypothetical protein n=1 Tax=Sinorhizobium TaxID=28105 RepID=UPI0004624EDC|nr:MULTISPECIES: hypothetical protein [Sinorhizobium]MDW9722553.1 hypothetical protein [Sinorhizobium meliloti]MDW9730769.1 hypothetical protein [Sinorhizobium meliloti]MDW9784893.1 hypothetical protein [Sinorhizobium meliloti]MDX0654368.1 hypothetical protein [Sinorhizobium medicae]MDX0980157.1 hypothetical protein [Sinorhizobium medicae]
MAKEMSIEGVFHHVQAIIAQGREDEFIKACKAQGYEKLTGPDGLIAFTRQFIGAALSIEELPSFPEMSDRFKTHMNKSLQVGKSYIDECRS